MSTKGQSTPVSLVWAASSVCSGKKGRSGKNWERALALALAAQPHLPPSNAPSLPAIARQAKARARNPKMNQ